ncbi:MAG: acylphosphatase [Coriobacteriales bacterium]|nr:acylphosphatase [Coriobacteriales bacterium]
METAGDIQRVRYRFIGHVQHRGFRYACSVAADTAQATGWVRNEPDGTVIAEVQTSKEGQLAFVKRLSSIVPGLGYDWSVGHEQEVDVRGGERNFLVRRF